MENITCSWIGKINIVKISILTKAIYRLNVIPISLPMVFSTELEQVISQFAWKHINPQIAKAILKKRIELEESTFLTSEYTTKLQSSRLAQTQKHRSMEQNRKSRDESTHMDTSSLTKRQNI